MDFEHEDLADNVDTASNYSFVDGETVRDQYPWHGTSVSGIIAARDNTVGVRGVAPRATIYSYNLLSGEETDMNEAQAMSQNAADTAIMNNSWGPGDSGVPSTSPEIWKTAIESAITTGYDGKGVFYVWAAGNGGSDDNSNLDEYANFYGVTAACAVNYDGERSGYSEQGANLWVCGPSNDSFFSFQPGITTTAVEDRYTTYFGGTSAAAPMISGVAALIRDANDALTWRDIKLILAASARKVDANDDGWTGRRPQVRVHVSSITSSTTSTVSGWWMPRQPLTWQKVGPTCRPSARSQCPQSLLTYPFRNTQAGTIRPQ